MGKTDYVLEPILRVLKDAEETPSSEIRLRVAALLGLSESERERIDPGSASLQPTFTNHIAHGLKNLPAYGHLEHLSTGGYRLTRSGAELAASPEPLAISDIKNKPPSTSPRLRAEESAAQSQAQSSLDLRAAWELAARGKSLGAGVV